MFWLLQPAAVADPIEPLAPQDPWGEVWEHLPETIINGEAARETEHPEAGGLIIGSGGVLLTVCSSTLIAPDVVLTAAHCVDPLVLGANNLAFYWSSEPDLSDYDGLSPTAVPPHAIEVSATVMHPDWDANEIGLELTLNHDVALMFLADPQGGSFAYLPTEDEAAQVVTGALVDVVGWGQTSQGGPSGIKMAGESVIGPLAEYEFQVGPSESDVRKCHGDSGGPTFLEVDTDSPVTKRVIGVGSHIWDKTDCTTTGAVETRVDYYLDWIGDTMEAACADGTRTDCEAPGIPSPPPSPDSIDPDELREDIKLTGCSTGGIETWWAPWMMALLFRRRGR